MILIVRPWRYKAVRPAWLTLFDNIPRKPALNVLKLYAAILESGVFVCIDHGAVARGIVEYLTDDLIFDALELFPAGAGPDMMIMNRRSQFQLRASRTATNATGAPSPMVDSVAGVPIVTTDAILSTEALEV